HLDAPGRDVDDLGAPPGCGAVEQGLGIFGNAHAVAPMAGAVGASACTALGQGVAALSAPTCTNTHTARSTHWPSWKMACSSCSEVRPTASTRVPVCTSSP